MTRQSTRQSPYVITLASVDRAVLEERSRAYTARFATVVRAKIVLLVSHTSFVLAALTRRCGRCMLTPPTQRDEPARTKATA